MARNLTVKRIAQCVAAIIILSAVAQHPCAAVIEKSAGCFDRMREHERLGQGLLSLHEPKKALAHFKAILAVEPNSLEALHASCNCLDQMGDYAGLIRVSDHILDLNPANGGCLLQRTIAFQNLHQNDKANAAQVNFNKYGYGKGTFALLFAIHGDSNSDEAIKRLEDQIALTPTCPDLYLRLCDVLSQTGQNAEAVRVAEEGVKAAPLHSWVWRMLEGVAGKSYFALGNKPRAIKCYDKALEGLHFGQPERPKIPPHALGQILLNRAEMHSAMNQTKEAIADLTLLIDNQSPHPTYYVERARRYLELKELDKALQDCNDAILVAHDNIAGLEARSLVLTALKRYDDSAKDLTVLIARAKDQTYLLQRATNYEMAKEYDKALGDYGTIIKMDRKEVMAYEQRARIYRKLGQADLAAKDEAIAKSIKSVAR